MKSDHDRRRGEHVPIIVNVDVMLAKRKMSSGELAERVGITQANLSILKTNKAKAIRFNTLEEICRALDCQPGDILEYRAASADKEKHINSTGKDEYHE